MKLLLLFILLTHASVNYGAKLISVKKNGRFIQLKLSERENLSLIVGSPVWIEARNNNLKSKGYMIHKSGRQALVELTTKFQGLKPGDVLQLSQRQTSLDDLFHDPGAPYFPDTPLCFALNCMSWLTRPVHQSKIELLRKRQHREQGGNQRNYRLTGLIWSWSSVLSDPDWIQLLKIKLEGSTLKGPAKLTTRNGDLRVNKDLLALEGRWTVPGQFLVTAGLNFYTQTFNGSAVIKSRHFFAWTVPRLVLSKKLAKNSEAGIFISGPVNLKSQQGEEIIRIQKSTWAGLFGRYPLHPKSTLAVKLVLEPWNSRLSSDQSSWKNSFHFRVSGDSLLPASVRAELSLFHNRPRYFSPDQGTDETRLSKTGLAIQLQKFRTTYGRPGLTIEIESGDVNESDQSGQAIQLSQVNSLIALTYEFRF